MLCAQNSLVSSSAFHGVTVLHGTFWPTVDPECDEVHSMVRPQLPLLDKSTLGLVDREELASQSGSQNLFLSESGCDCIFSFLESTHL